MWSRWAAKALLLSIGIGFIVNPARSGMAAAELQAAIVVKASPQASLQTEAAVDDRRLLQALAQLPEAQAAATLPWTDVWLTIRQPDGVARTYALSAGGALYAEAGQMIALPGEARRELLRMRTEARQRHYGRLIPWTEAQRLLPLKSVATVTDVESGIAFKAQRRAGSRHADMQPLTKADSAAMKTIYGGAWSWRRKAVIVEADGERIAASMHGMPHGGDGIPGNGFNGHFCIHFPGSTTHGSGQVDADHQWMVLKAAGEWERALAKASPRELVDSVLVAVNQQEPALLALAFGRSDHPALPALLSDMRSWNALKPPERASVKGKGRPPEPPEGPEMEGGLRLDLPMPLTVYRVGRRPVAQTFVFRLYRIAPVAPWLLADIERPPA